MATEQRPLVIPVSSLSWAGMLTLGLVTLIIGAIIVALPTLSLAAVGTLLGVVLIVSGIYTLMRALGGREGHERAWQVVRGVVFLLIGIALLRGVFLSVALIGLVIGFAWIIQGVLMLMESYSRTRRNARAGWTAFFGVISLIAGIVLLASPITSAIVLTLFVGCWFIVMGALSIWGSLVMRHTVLEGPAARGVSLPQQRAAEAEAAAAAADQSMASHAAPSYAPPGEHDVGQGTASQAAPGSTADQGTADESRRTSRHWHIPH